MFQAYQLVAQAIQERVKEIIWFDLDKGQLDNPEGFNSIITPGILIGNSDIEWMQLAGRNQIGNGTMTVKLVLRMPSETHLANPLMLDNLKALQLADPVNTATLLVPGVLSRIRYKDYPSPPFYVIEQAYQVQFKDGPTYTRKTVAVNINPYLINPNATT